MSGFVNSRFFRVYLVPGAVIQSVMVGGGYGTGREIVEFFTGYGFLGGLMGLVVTLVIFAVIFALTFEFARCFRVYDYRNFFKELLGPGWIAFEILAILLFTLVLAIMAAAAGNILRDNFGLSYFTGISCMLLVIGVLTFYGRELIAKVLTFWSFFLYAVFFAFFLSVAGSHWAPIAGEWQQAEIVSGWWLSGAKYALYNIAGAPLLLYVARAFTTRAEALKSGIVAGVIAVIPAALLQIAFFAVYPAVLNEAIPVYWMMGQLGMTILLITYSAMLFGTFIETGAGVLQGTNERINAYLIEKGHSGLNRISQAAIAVTAITISALLSLWGITNLIAEGYGTISWGFLFVYVLPLVTIGLYRICRTPAHGEFTK